MNISEEQLEQIRTYLNDVDANMFPGQSHDRCGRAHDVMFLHDMDAQEKLNEMMDLLERIEGEMVEVEYEEKKPAPTSWFKRLLSNNGEAA